MPSEPGWLGMCAVQNSTLGPVALGRYRVQQLLGQVGRVGG